MTTKVPAELSSTPSIVDNGNSTALTITSDEKVGLGVTTPANYLFSNPLAISAPSGNNSGITIISATNSNGTVAMADGTSGTEAYKGYLQYNHSSDAMFIGAGGSAIARFDAHGIKFGSDSAAANALDDYEEGTWTPTVSSGTITLASNASEYTKIGDMVFAQTRITGFSGGTSGSQFVLGGFPYTVGTDQSHIGTAWGNFDSGGKVTMFFYIGGGAYFGGTSYDFVNYGDLGSSTNVIISLIYRHG
mgnify:CR=1 FL=1